MDLISNNVVPADGERSVRTYCCTYYKSKLLGFETNGYLGVTNKRVIFQAVSDSVSGKNVIQSEVPIADVSGINSFKGIYFSLLSLLDALIVTGALGVVFFGLLTTIAMSIDSYTTFQVIAWIAAVGAMIGSFFVSVKSIWRPVLAGICVSSFFSLSSGFFGFGGSPEFTLILAGFALLYTLTCMYWYARRPIFSLNISSKGGSSTPIEISSGSSMRLLTISAGRSLNAEPAKDAEQMLKELGAVILDIQTMGDYGIEKWTQE